MLEPESWRSNWRTRTLRGYGLAASDGAVFAFGEAPFRGDARQLSLSVPVVAMAGSPSGEGYWLATADGAVHSFGDARALGDARQLSLSAPIVAMATSANGDGYWL
ncbi:MAG: hypothetical protein ACRDV9_15340, partial [Acidimicrobiia bacterium]